MWFVTAFDVSMWVSTHLCWPSPFMAKLYKKLTKKEQRKLKKRAEKNGKMVIRYRGRDGTKKLSGTKGLDWIDTV